MIKLIPFLLVIAIGLVIVYLVAARLERTRIKLDVILARSPRPWYKYPWTAHMAGVPLRGGYMTRSGALRGAKRTYREHERKQIEKVEVEI